MTITLGRRALWIALVFAGAVVLVAAVVLVGNPFGKSVSDRVSENYGSPAHCRLLGLAEIAGERTKVYSCAVRMLGGDAVICRAVIDGDVYPVSNEEYEGCGHI